MKRIRRADDPPAQASGPAPAGSETPTTTPTPPEAQRGSSETVTAPPAVPDGAELRAALAEAQAEAAANRDRYLRLRAELENYKRRLERTYADLAREGRKDLLCQLLEVLDNLERALAYSAGAPAEADERSLATGVRMTYLQLKDVLRREGVQEIAAAGQRFDPACHEAVATEPSTEQPEGVVVAEVRKGYRYGEGLLRPARVTVAARPLREQPDRSDNTERHHQGPDGTDGADGGG